MIADEIDDEIASLILTDHLEWNASQPTHLLLLQEKINTYLQFYESGEIFENREHLRNRKIIIKVVGLYPPNDEAKAFYMQVRKVLQTIGLELVFELAEDDLE